MLCQPSLKPKSVLDLVIHYWTACECVGLPRLGAKSTHVYEGAVPAGGDRNLHVHERRWLGLVGWLVGWFVN